MRQTSTAAIASPAMTLDTDVVKFRSQFDKTSPLDELVRTGAQRMLQATIEAKGGPVGTRKLFAANRMCANQRAHDCG